MAPCAAVVGGDRRVGQQRCAPRPRPVAESEQRGRITAKLVLPDCKWRDPDAAPDEQRTAAIARRHKPVSQRAHDRQRFSGLKLAQPPAAGADVLEQELELEPAVRAGESS